MDISRRLLVAAGRRDLHARERADTARETLEFDDGGAVRGCGCAASSISRMTSEDSRGG